MSRKRCSMYTAARLECEMRPDILTFTGQYFDFLTPSPESITIEAIAHALANTCRFGGHTSSFYSVAEHSVRVARSRYVPSWLKFDALMHDAAEAFVGDIPSPLKRILPDFKLIEARVEDAIEARFGCHEMHHPLVKNADLVLLATEQRDLMPSHDDEWASIRGIQPLRARIRPLTPRRAERAFLQAFSRYAPLEMAPMAEMEIAA